MGKLSIKDRAINLIVGYCVNGAIRLLRLAGALSNPVQRQLIENTLRAAWRQGLNATSVDGSSF